MTEELKILCASSKYIKAFAGLLSISLICLVFEFLGGGPAWEKAYDGFIFLTLLSLLLEFVDDRRVHVMDEKDLPSGLRRLEDFSKDGD